MKLLGGEQVKKAKKKADLERQERVEKLNTEESASVQKLNEALDSAEKEKEKINQEMEKLRQEVLERGDELREEILVLERKRATALLPINELKKEAETTLKKANKKIDEANTLRGVVERDREWLSEKLEIVTDRETQNVERDKEVKRKEKVIERAELELSNRTKSLSEKWIAYHKDVDVINKKVGVLAQKEVDLQNQQEGNNEFLKSLEKVDQDQKRERIALADGYRQLQKSRDEILGRKT